MSVLNLRLARKAKARAEREATACANRILHGRTRSERNAQAVETSRATRLLDGHWLADRQPVGHEVAQNDGD